jgi:ArsR family transcriptional regulator
MKLLDIYRCLGDETRLRMLHLLAQGPLCVCHFQAILHTPQVAISKHLAYLRRHGLVAARRHQQWMIYHLPQPCPVELQLQVQFLRDCARTQPVFQRDLLRLKNARRDCDWVASCFGEDHLQTKSKSGNPSRATRRLRKTSATS